MCLSPRSSARPLPRVPLGPSWCASPPSREARELEEQRTPCGSAPAPSRAGLVPVLQASKGEESWGEPHRGQPNNLLQQPASTAAGGRSADHQSKESSGCYRAIRNFPGCPATATAAAAAARARGRGHHLSSLSASAACCVHWTALRNWWLPVAPSPRRRADTLGVFVSSICLSWPSPHYPRRAAFTTKALRALFRSLIFITSRPPRHLEQTPGQLSSSVVCLVVHHHPTAEPKVFLLLGQSGSVASTPFAAPPLGRRSQCVQQNLYQPSAFHRPVLRILERSAESAGPVCLG